MPARLLKPFKIKAISLTAFNHMKGIFMSLNYDINLTKQRQERDVVANTVLRQIYLDSRSHLQPCKYNVLNHYYAFGVCVVRWDKRRFQSKYLT